MPNPFYIDPTAGRDPNALKGLGTAIQGYQERKKEAAQEADRKAKMQQAVDLYRSGDKSKVAEFMIANPELGAHVSNVMNQDADNVRAVTMEGVKRILSGEDPFQVIEETATKVEDLGGNATKTRALAGMPVEKIMEVAESRLLFEDPQAYQAFQASKPAPVEPVVVGKDASLVNPVTGEAVYKSTGGGPKPLPPSITQDVDASLAAKMNDAYVAAGGGDDGVKAAERMKATAQAESRKAQAAETLEIRYPNATAQDMAQIRAAFDSAANVKDGMGAAEKVREQQRVNVKANDMSTRGLALIDNILANDELDDVIGSVEGSDEGHIFGKKYRSDQEAEAIADIEELTNILTVPNMGVMTGVLSESDLRLLKTVAGGGLSRMRGEKRFREDARQIQRALRTAVAVSELTPKNREAFKWATDPVNKNDPNASKILKKLGIPND